MLTLRAAYPRGDERRCRPQGQGIMLLSFSVILNLMQDLVVIESGEIPYQVSNDACLFVIMTLYDLVSNF
jgi:hypothetical protein